MVEMHVKIPDNVLENLNLNLTKQRFPAAVQKCLFFPLGIPVIEKKSIPLSTQIPECMQLGCQIQICTLGFLLKKHKDDKLESKTIKIITKTLSPPQINVNHFCT